MIKNRVEKKKLEQILSKSYSFLIQILIQNEALKYYYKCCFRSTWVSSGFIEEFYFIQIVICIINFA